MCDSCENPCTRSRNFYSNSPKWHEKGRYCYECCNNLTFSYRDYNSEDGEYSCCDLTYYKYLRGNMLKLHCCMCCMVCINKRDCNGRTPLSNICSDAEINPRSINAQQEHDIIQDMLNRGANPNIQDNHGFTALMWALSRKKLVISRLLLKAGADPYIENEWGYTAFKYSRCSKSRYTNWKYARIHPDSREIWLSKCVKEVKIDTKIAAILCLYTKSLPNELIVEIFQY